MTVVLNALKCMGCGRRWMSSYPDEWCPFCGSERVRVTGSRWR